MSVSDLGLDELKARALHDDFDSTKYGAIAEEEINAAYREIVKTTSIAGGVITANLPPTAAADPDVALPSDNILVVDVRRANRAGALQPMERSELLALPVSSGDPEAYAIDGALLRFWPTPRRVETLLLDYRIKPPWLTGTDKPVLLDNDYRPALAWYARAALFAYEGDDANVALWTSRADRKLAVLRGDVQRRTRHNRRTPSMWAGTSVGPGFRIPGT